MNRFELAEPVRDAIGGFQSVVVAVEPAEQRTEPSVGGAHVAVDDVVHRLYDVIVALPDVVRLTVGDAKSTATFHSAGSVHSQRFQQPSNSLDRHGRRRQRFRRRRQLHRRHGQLQRRQERRSQLLQQLRASAPQWLQLLSGLSDVAQPILIGGRPPPSPAPSPAAHGSPGGRQRLQFALRLREQQRQRTLHLAVATETTTKESSSGHNRNY